MKTRLQKTKATSKTRAANKVSYMIILVLIFIVIVSTYFLVKKYTESSVVLDNGSSKQPASKDTATAPVYELKSSDASNHPIGNSVLPSTQ